MSDAPQQANKRRNRPGTKKQDLFNWTPHETLQGIDSTFALQEFIQQLLRTPKISAEDQCVLPKEQEEAEKPGWILEQFRQFLLELNAFIIHFDQVCTKEAYPEMKITAQMRGMKEGEDLEYLSSAFHPPRLVSAMDYMVLTLQQANSALMDQKLFPNRNTLSTKGKKEIKDHTRRLYRIFAFGFFAFPSTFYEFEKKTHLCERFTKFSKKYKLMDKELFLIDNKAFKKAYWKKL